ncbi:MAG: hypothetical protein Q9190_001059 [Brigantiaea leucoxantha]
MFLARKSWPPTQPNTNKEFPESKPVKDPILASLHIVKLYEFATVFPANEDFLYQCLTKVYKLWLNALIDQRDQKSELWYGHTKRLYIVWDGHRDEGSEWLDLPDYRLGDLIHIWKALKSLEEMAVVCDRDGFSSAITRELNDAKLSARQVRKIILKRFTCQPELANDIGATPLDKEKSVPGAKMHPHEAVENPRSEAVNSAVIAVRRSRARDRVLFYSKDTTLYDGLEWGFFQNDLYIDALADHSGTIKDSLNLCWERTVQAQGADQEPVWKKPLRYALAILMAKHSQSMDHSMSPADVEDLSWRRLRGCTMTYGLFAHTMNRDTKLPKPLNLSEGPRSPWEIPTILLRKRYPELECRM